MLCTGTVTSHLVPLGVEYAVVHSPGAQGAALANTQGAALANMQGAHSDSIASLGSTGRAELSRAGRGIHFPNDGALSCVESKVDEADVDPEAARAQATAAAVEAQRAQQAVEESKLAAERREHSHERDWRQHARLARHWPPAAHEAPGGRPLSLL